MADRGNSESPKRVRAGSRHRAIAENLPGTFDFQRMLAIADALPVLIAYLDTSQRYLFVNRALADWLGRPRKEILGRTMRELLGEETYRSREPLIQAALAGERQ